MRLHGVRPGEDAVVIIRYEVKMPKGFTIIFQ